MYRSSSMAKRGAPWLIGVGALQLAMGLFFIIGLGNIPYAGTGMVATGGVLAVIGVVLIGAGIVWLRKAADSDRISDSGTAGVGQVTGLTQTGTLVNHQPVIEIELLVSVPGWTPYPARVKEPVPMILLNRLQGSLPVRVDPARPERVVIQWDRLNDPSAFGMAAAPGAMGAMPGMPVGMPVAGAPAGAMPVAAAAPVAAGMPVAAAAGPGSGADETLAQVAAAMAAAGTGAAPVFAQQSQAGYSIEQLRAYVRANGISGTARVDALVDSGSTIGDERLFTMTTTVFLPDRIPFTSGPSAAMVPLEKVPRMAVGVELPVKVAPDNENLLMFEWDKV